MTVVTQIRNDAHANKVAHGDYAWGKEGDGFSKRWVLNSFSRRAVYLVADDGIPVATFSLDWDDETYWGPQEPIAGYVHGLCVRKGFNGRGLGSFIIDWCANQVRILNRRFVRLGCDARNTRLCAYYESLGFVRVGTKPMPESTDYMDSLYEKPVNPMRERPSARLLITTSERRVLLFRFVHRSGALAGKAYWATPGGGVEDGETFEDAAIREFREETGICAAQVSKPVGRRQVPLQLPDGEHVLPVELYFVIYADAESISRDSWTAEEMEVMADHKWWSREELSSTTETVYPEGLVQMLDNAGVFGAERPL
ncbi:bifunctional GNAT family N-acetyltransferase/NUDIX hydrolase [Burkholderia gladioli pv. gladioli]|uniref:bifunctional GNAT family N-acetyltransferase/NUDIX hydrolase n=1 Tax=Burkholderia gladioli TaxID=28095 RepID=UPI001ABB55BC|nr:bifunctional GNAT family N-acetyltransferase/NUDIX hydrolase [Burkholderia gladioli]MDJ1160292.1 bifunctional GNAT family N-acetyltransferase/NUDIX hydrolase [Burkholderia gladioli pv. gladioli]